MAAVSEAPSSITGLPELVDGLAPNDRARFRRMYAVISAEGRLRAPEAMQPWIERTFGPLPSVETQRIVRVVNLVTGEAAVFNDLRARRPVRGELAAAPGHLQELANDPWARPLESTPEDAFGRLANGAAVTAANVAKYDAHHSLIVFDEPDPLRFDRASVRGCVELAGRWFAAAHASDAEAVYPFFLWNCLWRAGGSIVHGHAQVQLARGRHYAKIEALRRASQEYRKREGACYFEDLARVHTALGLAGNAGDACVMASLTPAKEKEVLILAPAFGEALADALFDTLAAFRDALGVRSFNVGVQMPPLGETAEEWAGFPVVAHVLDRGDLGTRTSDIGGMELFAEPVVASDPFAVARALEMEG